MNVPRLTSCCCGCSLRDGSLIIGWLSMVPSIVMFLLTILGLIMATIFMDDDSTEANMKVNKEAFLAVAVFLVVITILFMAASSMLLWGVYKKSPLLLLIWIVLSLIIVGGKLLVSISALIESPQPLMALEVPGYVISIYFIWVVHSHYKEVRYAPKSGPV